MDIKKEMLTSFIGNAALQKENKESKEESTIHFYKDLMAKKTILYNRRFSMSDKKTGVYFFDNGIKVFLPTMEMYYNLSTKKTLYLGSKALSRTYNVIVTDVDEANKLVTVSFTKAQALVRPAGIEYIDNMLANGGNETVKARISSVPKDDDAPAKVVYLDLLGLNIMGRLSRKEWSDMYVPDLKIVAKINDVIDVKILSKAEPYNGEPSYICSRVAAFTKSSWDDIEEKAPLNSGIIVKCICRLDNLFIGEVQGLKETWAYCFYPDPESNVPTITVGKLYRGYVSHVNAKNHIFKCRILAEVDS